MLQRDLIEGDVKKCSCCQPLENPNRQHVSSTSLGNISIK